MADIDKLCTTCVFQETPSNTTVCQTCIRGGVPDAPHWKGWHYAEEKQEAAAAVESLTRLTLGAVMAPAGHDREEAGDVQDGPFRATLEDWLENYRASLKLSEKWRKKACTSLNQVIAIAQAEIARLEKYGG